MIGVLAHLLAVMLVTVRGAEEPTDHLSEAYRILEYFQMRSADDSMQEITKQQVIEGMFGKHPADEHEVEFVSNGLVHFDEDKSDKYNVKEIKGMLDHYEKWQTTKKYLEAYEIEKSERRFKMQAEKMIQEISNREGEDLTELNPEQVVETLWGYDPHEHHTGVKLAKKGIPHADADGNGKLNVEELAILYADLAEHDKAHAEATKPESPTDHLSEAYRILEYFQMNTADDSMHEITKQQVIEGMFGKHPGDEHAVEFVWNGLVHFDEDTSDKYNVKEIVGMLDHYEKWETTKKYLEAYEIEMSERRFKMKAKMMIQEISNRVGEDLTELNPDQVVESLWGNRHHHHSHHTGVKLAKKGIPHADADGNGKLNVDELANLYEDIAEHDKAQAKLTKPEPRKDNLAEAHYILEKFQKAKGDESIHQLTKEQVVEGMFAEHDPILETEHAMEFVFNGLKHFDDDKSGEYNIQEIAQMLDHYERWQTTKKYLKTHEASMSYQRFQKQAEMMILEISNREGEDLTELTPEQALESLWGNDPQEEHQEGVELARRGIPHVDADGNGKLNVDELATLYQGIAEHAKAKALAEKSEL